MTSSSQASTQNSRLMVVVAKTFPLLVPDLASSIFSDLIKNDVSKLLEVDHAKHGYGFPL